MTWRLSYSLFGEQNPAIMRKELSHQKLRSPIFAPRGLFSQRPGNGAQAQARKAASVQQTL